MQLPLSQAIQDAIAGLGHGAEDDAGVSLELPSGRSRFIFRDYLVQDLERRARYSPETLAKRLSELEELITHDPSIRNRSLGPEPKGGSRRASR
jgi:hypothetical protein